MSLETLIEAAKYLEYQSNATSRGEIPKDYTSFASFASACDDSGTVLVFPSSSDASTGDNSYTFTDDVRERRDPRDRRNGAGGTNGDRGGGSGSGTREVHNKLEKNRRAHLKKCFETLKKQIPNMDDKKTSNLGILRSALRYIQSLRRKEREFEHDMERLAREKITLQQRLIALRKELSSQVDQGVISSVMLNENDNDSNSTSTASECGPPSDAEEEKSAVLSISSTPVTASSVTKTEAPSGATNGSSLVVTAPPPQKMLVPATVGHVFGRTLAPHPQVLATANAAGATTLTFGPRLQLAQVGFPTQGFHAAGLNGGSTLLPAVQVLTTQQGAPVRRLIAAPLGAAPGVTLTVGPPATVATTATTHLAYAGRPSVMALTAAQQQLPVTASLASVGGAVAASRLASRTSVAQQLPSNGAIAFAQLAVKSENSAFAALTAAAALSFQNAVAAAPTNTTSTTAAITNPPGAPVIAVPNATNSAANAKHSNNNFARLVAATATRPVAPQQQQQMVLPMTSVIVPTTLNHNNNHVHHQQPMGKMVTSAPAGFLQQFLPQLSGVKPLVVVSAAPTLTAVAGPAHTTTVSR